jgi:hypothetical protein
VADRWRANELKAEGIGHQVDKANVVLALAHQ